MYDVSVLMRIRYNTYDASLQDKVALGSLLSSSVRSSSYIYHHYHTGIIEAPAPHPPPPPPPQQHTCTGLGVYRTFGSAIRSPIISYFDLLRLHIYVELSVQTLI